MLVEKKRHRCGYMAVRIASKEAVLLCKVRGAVTYQDNQQYCGIR